jgi:hypothetical protein
VTDEDRAVAEVMLRLAGTDLNKLRLALADLESGQWLEFCHGGYLSSWGNRRMAYDARDLLFEIVGEEMAQAIWEEEFQKLGREIREEEGDEVWRVYSTGQGAERTALREFMQEKTKEAIEQRERDRLARKFREILAGEKERAA